MHTTDVPTSGLDAHAQGLPMSACPYSPADPAGHEWRAGWIKAEAGARYRAGTYGATPEQYQAAGLQPPAHAGQVAGRLGYFLTPEARAAMAKAGAAFAAGMSQLASACQAAAQGMAEAFAQIETDQLVALGINPVEVARIADAFGVPHHLVDTSLPAPPGPRRTVQRHRPCPQHGPTKAGTCLPCARTHARKARR